MTEQLGEADVENPPVYEADETAESGLDTGDWRDELTERQQKEVQFAEVYASQFAHGTAGHNQLILIAKMASILDRYEQEIKDLLEEE